MAKYRIIYEDPDEIEAPASVVSPSDNWLWDAMNGKLPPIWVYWQLQDDEKKAIEEGKKDYTEDFQRHALQKTAQRIGPLTEEEAMEYLVLMVVPRKVWSQKHNKPMLRIVEAAKIPSDRTFRNAWSVN